MYNKEDFIAIIKENEGLIYKVTKIYTGNGADEQDLYQEIVYQLWKSFPSFRNDARITTWMYRVALNTAIAYLNREKRTGRHLPVNEVLINTADTVDTVKEERLELLYVLIKKLSIVEKGIMFLYLEGKTYDEMALITGFTVTNIGTRLGRIKQKIASQIKK